MPIHKSVLSREIIELLNLKEGSTVVDATLGGGGHSGMILEKIGDAGKLIAIDLDRDALGKFKIESEKLRVKSEVYFINDNFANLEKILKTIEVDEVDAIVADLGWSSDQMEDPGRGMSFIIDGGLDMRLDSRQKKSAATVVNEYNQLELERIIKNFGEEKFFRRIASQIVEKRKAKKIETTLELAEIIKLAIPKKFQTRRIHPATKTFQAIRIEVNQELESLKSFLSQSIQVLKPRGRLAIISFHSLEDRIVKNFFRQNARGCICPDSFPTCQCGEKPKIKIITKKPIVATQEEIERNKRARSARLRVSEKL